MAADSFSFEEATSASSAPPASGADTFDFDEALGTKQPLPAGVKAGTAGGGRGSVNPPTVAEQGEDLSKPSFRIAKPVSAKPPAPEKKRESVLDDTILPEAPAIAARQTIDTARSTRRGAEALTPEGWPAKTGPVAKPGERDPLAGSNAMVEGAGLRHGDLPMAGRIVAKMRAQGAEAVGGITEAVGDFTGIKPVSDFGKNAVRNAHLYQQGIGKPRGANAFNLGYAEEMLEGAGASLLNSYTLARAFGAKAVIPLMTTQAAGSYYDRARTAGKDPAEALALALAHGGFEALGEKFALTGKAMGALQTMLTKGASREALQDAGAVLLRHGVREIPGEWITYLGQSAVDVLPGVGINQNMTGAEFIDGLRDTTVQAAMMGGMMGAGGAVAAARGKGAPRQLSAEEIARDKGFLQRDEQIDRLNKAGEKGVADSMKRQLASERSQAELAVLADKPWAQDPEFQTRYQQLRTGGLPPAEAAARAAMAGGFLQLTEGLQLEPRHAEKAIEAAAALPIDKAPGFFDRFVASLVKKGRAAPVPDGTVGGTLEGLRDDALETQLQGVYDEDVATTSAAIEKLEAGNAPAPAAVPAEGGANPGPVNPGPDGATVQGQGQSDEPPVPEGMTRLYHGSATHGRVDGPAWFSTDRKYAQDYRAGAELQYVDYPTEKVNAAADPDGYGQTPAKGFTWNVELDASETGPRRALTQASQAPADDDGQLDPATLPVFHNENDVRAHTGASSPTNGKTATPAQILAGNAPLGHMKLGRGAGRVDVSIENAAGSERVDLKNTPPKWKTPMEHGFHYGYFRGTKGGDGEHIDGFFQEGLADEWAGDVFVVDQFNDDGTFDEHKVIVGASGNDDALRTYNKHYAKGWKGGKAVTRMSWGQFQAWAKEEQTQPVAGGKAAGHNAPTHTPAEAPTTLQGAAGNAVNPAQDSGGPAETAPGKDAPAPAQRGKAGLTAARKAAWDKNPLRYFLASHGLHTDLAPEFAPGTKERRSALVPGIGPIFKKTGLQLDELAQRAVEDGFLAEADADKLYDLIAAAFRGERIAPMFTADGAELEAARRMQDAQERAEAEAALADLSDEQLQDFAESVSPLEDDYGDIPVGRFDDGDTSNATTEQFLRAMGAPEEEIQDAIRAENEAAQRALAAQEGDEGGSEDEQVEPDGQTPGAAAGAGQAQPDRDERGGQRDDAPASGDRRGEDRAQAASELSWTKLSDGTLAVDGPKVVIREVLAGMRLMETPDGLIVSKKDAQRADMLLTNKMRERPDAATSTFSDDPDFLTTWPRPTGDKDGTAFQGLVGSDLMDEVIGIHQEIGAGLQSDQADAEALVNGLKRNIDPATGKEPKAGRREGMATELKVLLNNMVSTLNDYGMEFPQHQDAFEAATLGPKWQAFFSEAYDLIAATLPAENNAESFSVPDRLALARLAGEEAEASEEEDDSDPPADDGDAHWNKYDVAVGKPTEALKWEGRGADKITIDLYDMPEGWAARVMTRVGGAAVGAGGIASSLDRGQVKPSREEALEWAIKVARNSVEGREGSAGMVKATKAAVKWLDGIAADMALAGSNEAAAQDLLGATPNATQQAAAKLKAEREEADRRKLQAAPSPDGFMLAGSDRAADVGAAAGQAGMFDGGPSEAPAARTLLTQAEQDALGVRHAAIDAKLDAMSDAQVRELYARAGLAGSKQSPEAMLKTLKGEHPDDMEPLLAADDRALKLQEAERAVVAMRKRVGLLRKLRDCMGGSK